MRPILNCLRTVDYSVWPQELASLERGQPVCRPLRPPSADGLSNCVPTPALPANHLCRQRPRAPLKLVPHLRADISAAKLPLLSTCNVAVDGDNPVSSQGRV